VNVAGQAVELGDQEFGTFTPGLFQCVGEFGTLTFVSAGFNFGERGDDLVASGASERGDVGLLGFEAETGGGLFLAGDAVVGDGFQECDQYKGSQTVFMNLYREKTFARTPSDQQVEQPTSKRVVDLSETG